MPDAPPRPPALTMACLFIAIASLMLLVNLVSLLSSWTSFEVQDEIRKQLDDPMVRDLGLSADRVVTALRYATFALVPLSVAGMVFAIYAMRGHRASRIFLTVLSGLGFLVLASTGLAGIIPAALLLASAATLWSSDARRWYALKNGKPAPDKPTRPDPFSAAPTQPRQAHPQPHQSQPHHPQPPQVQAAPGYAPYAPFASQPSHPDQRPNAVLISGLLTVIGSAAALLGGLALLASATVGKSEMRRAIEDSKLASDYLKWADITVDDVLRLYLIGGVVIAVAGLLGLLAGGLLLLRRRIGLQATRVMCIVTMVVSVLTLPMGLLTGAAAIYVFVQLLRPQNVAWFTRPRP